MSIERSRGRRRPRPPRPGATPLPQGTVLADPLRDPKTGRFGPGNTAAKLRVLKGAGRALIGLNPQEVAPWLRPFVSIANSDASRLVEENGILGDTALMRLAEDVAAAHAVFRGLLALGAAGDREALAEAKVWLREHRQSVLSLKGEAREHSRDRPAPSLAWMTIAPSEDAEPQEDLSTEREPGIPSHVAAPVGADGSQ